METKCCFPQKVKVAQLNPPPAIQQPSADRRSFKEIKWKLCMNAVLRITCVRLTRLQLWQYFTQDSDDTAIRRYVYRPLSSRVAYHTQSGVISRVQRLNHEWLEDRSEKNLTWYFCFKRILEGDAGKLRNKFSMTEVKIWDHLSSSFSEKKKQLQKNKKKQLYMSAPREAAVHISQPALSDPQSPQGDVTVQLPPSKQRSSTHSHQGAHFESFHIGMIAMLGTFLGRADKWRGSSRRFHLIHLIKHWLFVVMCYIWIKLSWNF